MIEGDARRRLWGPPFLFLVGLSLGTAWADPAPILPIRFERAWPALKFSRPVCLAEAPGDPGRRFVLEQGGRIMAFPAKEDADRASCYLDLSKKTLRYHEESGLLGLAFHPRFAENGYLFVYYSDKTSYKGGAPHKAILARFHAGPKAEKADPDSETVLLTVDQPYPNHNGGGLLFGPDGCLYLGLGDGGAAGDPHDNAQNPRSFLGKMLRLDVDHPAAGKSYAIPEGNPFARAPEKGLPEIFALGLRNPWRFSFDRKTGELWAGDVGQDRFEWIHLVKRGGNHGWNRMEGNHPFNQKRPKPEGELIAPVAEYSHEEGQSVTGGYVYRGKRFPKWDGIYFYADYISGKVWGLRKGENPALVAERGLLIASFAEDIQGELFAVSLSGEIWRLCQEDSSP